MLLEYSTYRHIVQGLSPASWGEFTQVFPEFLYDSPKQF
jgi:hypothetical protein